MKDRFTEAVKELSEKNAFICSSCGSETIIHAEGERKAVTVPHEKRESEEELHVRGMDVGLTRTEEIIISDPTPFGA